MKKIFLLLGLALTACNGANVSSGKTLVDVNGEKITEGHLEFLAGMNPGIARQMATPFGKKQILDNLVEQELLYQAARRDGIHRDPATQAKIDLYKKVIIAQTYVEAQADREAKKYYEANPAEFEQLKLSHILIRYASPEEIQKVKKKEPYHRTEPAALKLANAIYEKLTKGEKFETLAETYSEDPLTKGRGGDFGPVAKNDPRLVRRGFAPLVEKAFAMKVGEFAGPIKTTGGYHLLTLTAPAQVIPFEEVKNQLVFRKTREMRDQLLNQLKEKGKVVYADELKPTEPAATEGAAKEAPAETPPHPPHEDHDGHSPPPPAPAQNDTGAGKQ
ncbi:MAG: peptidylprolyl isomerase [Deltaproteobacteria bacterium]|nr:peptidylprolyl isomerase [Deltaproteobacteria bacterium]